MLETLNWFWNVSWNIFKVAFGLGFVIFIHELGHFVLAKWNGVKVEKFSIGFGPSLLGFKRGETEYVLAAVPLGGFVKMLGEEPADEDSKSTDPRAYSNKSVGARMAIISAGVIMNVILGLGCFVYAYGQGMVVLPAKVGGVQPGSPAYDAGLRAGDEIVAIDGRGDLSWESMTLKVVLSSQGQALRFEVKRPDHENLLGLDIQPRRETGSDRPVIGVRPSSSLNIGILSLPVGMKNPPVYPQSEVSEDAHPVIDTLMAVGPAGQEPTPVRDIVQYYRLLARFRGQPLVHVIERREWTDDAPGKVLNRLEVTFPPANFVDFGFRMSFEPIAAIRKDSPADRAGFRKGDQIVNVKVNGRDELDPVRLPSICYDNAGELMTFEVERAAADGSKTSHTLTATPDDTPPWTEMPAASDALDVPGLGLCYPVRPHIAAVVPGSPAARAGLKSGDVISAVTIAPPRYVEVIKVKGSKMDTPAVKPETISFDEASPAWIKAFWTLQYSSDATVTMIVNKGSKPIEIKAEPDPDWIFPPRGLGFMPLFQKLPPQSMVASLRRGWDDTIENILSIYGTIRNLVLGRLGPKGLAGPIRIVGFAYKTARSSMNDLIHFLGFLSINLAVINFLPIPPLDGGQMLFLIAEKVRGRPLPESALGAGIVVGLVLVVCLMIFVLFQDVLWSIENWKGVF
jgi:regulator of sigma E protease